jgi:CTP synthase (UTP-ammonia lyase)
MDMQKSKRNERPVEGQSSRSVSLSSAGIALVGDHSVDVLAHRAIENCFSVARQSNPDSVGAQWIPTDSIKPGDGKIFEPFDGIWCVPASPYRSTDGALFAIRYARENSVPFLGTCGGYQHALLEYARNVLGLEQAGHTELDSGTPLPLLEGMQCSLIEQTQPIFVTNDTFRLSYGGDSGVEGFHCSYGLNPNYEQVFAGTPLEIVARSKDGQARAFQLKGHPFFVGTQFQPERRVLEGSLHPIVESFFAHVQSRLQPTF